MTGSCCRRLVGRFLYGNLRGRREGWALRCRTSGNMTSSGSSTSDRSKSGRRNPVLYDYTTAQEPARRCRTESEPAVTRAVGSHVAEWKQTETEIPVITHEIERISNEDARSRQLRQIPGFGPLVATATVAASANDSAFRRGRDFAAWAGVVPRQYSTGGNQKLYGISGANLSVAAGRRSAI